MTAHILNNKYLYGIGLGYVLLCALCISMEFYWVLLLPFVLLIILLAIYSLDKLLLLIAFFTPLSVNFQDIGLGVGISIPTEPLLFGVLILAIIKLLYEGKIDYKLLNHPISTAIIINTLWLLITSFSSSMPLVSLKFVVSRLWYIVAFYILGVYLFKNKKNIAWFLSLYIAGLLLVITYTIFNHSQLGFDSHAAHWVMDPFYKDHTSYGAALAMFYPVLIYFLSRKENSGNQKVLLTVCTVVFTLAIVLSYTRAAWLSMAAALGILLILWLKIKFRTIMIVSGTVVALFFSLQTEIIMKLEKNRQDSSSDLAEHITSIMNISSDASNLERLNRWASAFRMFAEQPIFGWGPGTYMFQYAPFQMSNEKTIISTNAGDMGNAHSEYIGPLAESGILGSLTFVLIVVYTFITAVKIQREQPHIRGITIAVLLSLTTYFVHGLFNNFLDTDKASVPFWGMLAILTALDLYHSNNILHENRITELE